MRRGSRDRLPSVQSPAWKLDSVLKLTTQRRIEQEASGGYAGDFDLQEPGLYLVRARSGAQMVSGGIVRNASAEAATGQVNTAFLQRICAMSGGELLKADATELPRAASTRSRVVELAPMLLTISLLLFLPDVALRRWENLLGVTEALRQRLAAAAVNLRQPETA